MEQRDNRRKRVVVVGGGISGLSAAFYTRRALAAKGMEADVTVVEKSEAVGGKLRTLHRDGFVIEQGPDSFLARKTPIIELTRDLGLEGELTGTNPRANKTYIVRKGKLHRMPKGLSLGVPTELKPFLSTPLVSPLGKARAALDLVIPASRDDGDESLGGFLERRIGREALERLAEPILAGIYAGDMHKLSLKATFPQFKQVERKYGSLIKGMMAGKLNPPAPSPIVSVIPAEIRSSVFLTYRNGLVTVLDGLRKQVGEDNLMRDAVIGLAREEGRYWLALERGGTLEADAVVLALPAFELAPLLRQVEEADWLATMEYISVANIVFAFRRSELAHPLDGSGFVVPRSEGRFITACTWTSSKWLHTAPEGHALIRCYVGRAGEQEWTSLSDAELVTRVRRDLFELMGLRAQPLFTEVTRLYRSMPQYAVGHLDRVRRLRERLKMSFPGVFVTGAAFEGVGIPDCVKQAKDAAEAATSHVEALPAS